MTKSESKPNIILINCDDLGYGDLGCYGSNLNNTPYIDGMAEEGLLFTDFYMASAVCSPSRGAMLTGCYPPRIGFGDFTEKKTGVLFPGDNEGLNSDEITIAKQLKKAGYKTKIVGKWHCGDQPEFLPLNHGFDEYFGLPYSNDMGLQRDSDFGVPLPLIKDNRIILQQPDQIGLTQRYAEESLEFIRSNADKNFFLYLAHMYVHVPLFVPRHFLEKSRNGGYGGAVECIDWVSGIILNELKTLGIDEKTLVIFTSDNGSRARDEGGSNLPLKGTKGSLWDGGIRVPCIMRWPGVIPKGVKSSELVTSMDLFPTFSALSGVDIPDDRIIDGKDITDILKSPESQKSPHSYFAYYHRNDLEAVRNSRWKLHLYRDSVNVQELYDLENDMGETKNLYKDYPGIVKELENAAEIFRQELGDEATGTIGKNIRPCGRVDSAKTLTTYDPDHPYMVAMYDLADSKILLG